MPTNSQINQYPAGRPGLVKPKGMNELVDAVNAHSRNIEALWSWPAPSGFQLVTTYLFKPTDEATRDGVYTGVLYRMHPEDFDPDKAGTVDPDDIGSADAPDEEDPDNAGVAIGINIAEIGKTGHAIDVDADAATNGYPCILRSVNSDGRAVVLFWTETPAGLFAVNVSNPTGSSGTQSTAPTYTYDVMDLDGNPIGSTKAVVWARSHGKVIAGTHGAAYYASDGSLVLLMVDEVRDTSGC